MMSGTSTPGDAREIARRQKLLAVDLLKKALAALDQTQFALGAEHADRALQLCLEAFEDDIAEGGTASQ